MNCTRELSKGMTDLLLSLQRNTILRTVSAKYQNILYKSLYIYGDAFPDEM